MALDTPTTKEISDNIIAQLQASLNQKIPLLPKSFLRVLAKVLAGLFVLLYKYGGFMFLQIFVETATIAETEINGKNISPLIAWGRLVGVGDPVSATNAEMEINVAVVTQGGTLSSGSQLYNAENGVTYLTVGDVLLNAPTVQAVIIAVSDQAGGGGSGDVGNLEIGAIVTFANPIADINREADISDQLVTGADQESDAAYRQRIIDRFRKTPQGGAYADYELWGEEVPGIINVYPYTGMPGQVDVYSEATEESSGSPDGIPTAAQLLAVKESIELNVNGIATRRPANAFVNSLAISRTAFDVSVIGLEVDDLGGTQILIDSAVKQYFMEREPFVDGLSILPRKDRITKSAVTGVVEDVVTAEGGIFQAITLDLDTVPIDVYSLGEGEKAKSEDVVFA